MSVEPADTSHFGVADYVVFCGMLAVSAGIGIYYACSGGKQKTAREFLMADRNMGIIPICMSLLASFLSGISLIGIPAEVYMFGASAHLNMIGLSVAVIFASFYLLPVFYHLNVTSAYEYLERRFNKLLRVFGALIYMIHMLMYMAIVTYAPALALSQVTGLHTWSCVGAIGGVCIFYTSLGGMKAVMWTDATQIVVMYVSMLVVVVKGTMDVGGLSALWSKNIEGGRLNVFILDADPTTRHTVWGLAIGGFFAWVATYGTNQAQVQRFLTAPTKRRAQIAVWLNVPGFYLLNAICVFCGLILYARYWNCDPIRSKRVEAPDQMMPVFVMEILGNVHGIPGLFVAGVFSGALSTLSSGLNSLAAVALEDIVKIMFVKEMSEERAGTVSKIIAVGYGILTVATVAVAERMGNILQAAVTIFGMVSGPILGVFTLGMFLPWCNSKGAVMGTLLGFALILWIGIGQQISQPPKPFLETSVEGCPVSSNASSVVKSSLPSDGSEIFYLYRISYTWYSVISWLSVVVIGLIVSALTGFNDPDDVDPDLLSPLVKGYFVRRANQKKQETSMAMWSAQSTQVKPPSSAPNGLNRTDLPDSGIEANGADNPAFQPDQNRTPPPKYNQIQL